LLQEVKLADNEPTAQFVFRPGVSTTDAIFALHSNYHTKFPDKTCPCTTIKNTELAHIVLFIYAKYKTR